MNQLQLFNFDSYEIRVILINDEPYFVANEVAKVLGYKNPSKATNDHCKKSFMSWGNDSLGRRQEFKVIPESDVYRLIIKSKLPQAEKFESWVMEKVLPSIRKRGVYLTDQKALDITTNPNSLADLLLQAGEQLKQKDLVITELQPKALFADAVSASRTSILVRELAKLLNQNGIEIGQNRLFEWLREKGYLIKRKGADYNMPTQYSMDLKLFEIQETTISRSNGEISIQRTPKVTGKGQRYFIDKFLKAQEEQRALA